MSRGFRPSETLLTLAAVLGGCCIVAFLAGTFLGIRPLVVTSGSMSPAIATGDLAVARAVPAEDLRVGDVVSVVSGTGVRVTHRVVGAEQDGPVVELSLQGDANQAPDAETYPVTTADRVLFRVPRGGYVVAAFSSPVGLMVTGILLAIVVWTGLGPPRGAARRRTALTVGAAAAVVLVAPVATRAYFTDTAGAGTGQLAAYAVPAPATFTCGAIGVFSVSFSWTAVSGATSYTLHYGSGGASTLTTSNTSATVTTAISGGTAWVEANRAFGSTTWTSVPSRTRTYTVALASLCS